MAVAAQHRRRTKCARPSSELRRHSLALERIGGPPMRMTISMLWCRNSWRAGNEVSIGHTHSTDMDW